MKTLHQGGSFSEFLPCGSKPPNVIPFLFLILEILNVSVSPYQEIWSSYLSYISFFDFYPSYRGFFDYPCVNLLLVNFKMQRYLGDISNLLETLNPLYPCVWASNGWLLFWGHSWIVASILLQNFDIQLTLENSNTQFLELFDSSKNSSVFWTLRNFLGKKALDISNISVGRTKLLDPWTISSRSVDFRFNISAKIRKF